jgi:prevent-host-death family protein
MNTFSLSGARAELPTLVKSVHEEFGRVTITVNGKSKALLISPEEIEAYEETIATLSDGKAVKALIQSEKDWASGNVFSHKDVFGR